MPRQADGVGSEGIGFDYFRTRLQVFVMDFTNHLRLRAVQFVIAAVDEHSLGVQKGAHGAVARHRSLLQPGKKLRSHVQENTGFGGDSADEVAQVRALLLGANLGGWPTQACFWLELEYLLTERVAQTLCFGSA